MTNKYKIGEIERIVGVKIKDKELTTTENEVVQSFIGNAYDLDRQYNEGYITYEDYIGGRNVLLSKLNTEPIETGLKKEVSRRLDVILPTNEENYKAREKKWLPDGVRGNGLDYLGCLLTQSLVRRRFLKDMNKKYKERKRMSRT